MSCATCWYDGLGVGRDGSLRGSSNARYSTNLSRGSLRLLGELPRAVVVNDERPQRVRVTGPPRRAGTVRPHSRLGDVHEQTALGGIYLRSLLREQLLLAGRVLVLMAVSLGSMPMVFHFWPELTDQRILGLPLAWVVLGGLGYPLLLLLGWHYVRRVERNEAAFVELVHGEVEEGQT